jgi:endonuclease YncB( thermonuclease family)
MGCIYSTESPKERSSESPNIDELTPGQPVENKLQSDSYTENKQDPFTKLKNVYDNCTYENTPYYSYENLKTYVKILKIIDGDTVDLALYYEDTNKTFKHRVRLYGIDTPEKRPLKSNENREKEIESSKISTKALTDKIIENGNILTALFYKPDKYGRLLCTLYDKNGEDINEWMIKQGFAYEYFGKTKKKFGE